MFKILYWCTLILVCRHPPAECYNLLSFSSFYWKGATTPWLLYWLICLPVCRRRPTTFTCSPTATGRELQPPDLITSHYWQKASTSSLKAPTLDILQGPRFIIFQTGYSWYTSIQYEGHVSSNFHTGPISNIEAQNQSSLQYNHQIHLHQPITETQSSISYITETESSISKSTTFESINHWKLRRPTLNQNSTNPLEQTDHCNQYTNLNPEHCINNQNQLQPKKSYVRMYTLLQWIQPSCIGYFL